MQELVKNYPSLNAENDPIVNDNKEVLLVKHNKKAKHQTDSYGIPAGKSEKGETISWKEGAKTIEETMVLY